MRKAVFIYSSQFEKYRYPLDHPFNITRAGKVREVVNSLGLLSAAGRSEVAPEYPDRVVLKKFHTARYLHMLKSAAEGKWQAEAMSMGIGTPDCPVFDDMYDFSALACGATIKGAELILSGDADVAFNPSGGLHHSGPERASGFCYMNDVAIGCEVLAEKGKRVLYLDIDAHHGDGVAYGFYDRSDVMTISFHQNPRTLFPGTGFEDEIGSGDGKGYCVNVPLPIGTYDQAYMQAFEAIALPLITAYNPDVIVLQAGADCLAGDPLAQLYLTNNVFADVIKHLLAFNKPILAAGGGGYNFDNTVRAWTLVWASLCGAADDHDMNLGVGGVMLGNTDWQGGLRDRVLPISAQQKNAVIPALKATIKAVKKNVFAIHGL